MQAALRLVRMSSQNNNNNNNNNKECPAKQRFYSELIRSHLKCQVQFQFGFSEVC